MKARILFLLAFFPFIVNGQIISFQDSNVKKICVHYWDTDGDGELSQTEAAAVTSIGTIFNNNISIKYFEELEYFTGLNSIANEAFANCSSLNKIKLPNDLSIIGEYAFSSCSSLASITIPYSVTSIGNYAFSGCKGMTSVTINSNSIISKAYTSSLSLCNIFGSQVRIYTLGNSVKSIGDYAFYNCSSMTSVTIPNSVTSIGRWAFYGCI